MWSWWMIAWNPSPCLQVCDVFEGTGYIWPGFLGLSVCQSTNHIVGVDQIFVEWEKLRASTFQYWDSLVAQTVKRLPRIQETQVHLWVRKIPWRRTWQPIPELLPRNFHGWRSLVGYSPCGHKELDTTERFHFHFHISILYMKSKPYI